VSGSPQPGPCDCSLTEAGANQTGLLDFGHLWRGVPETLHIGTYPEKQFVTYAIGCLDRRDGPRPGFGVRGAGSWIAEVFLLLWWCLALARGEIDELAISLVVRLFAEDDSSVNLALPEDASTPEAGCLECPLDLPL
jgi:hypothetical protein